MDRGRGASVAAQGVTGGGECARTVFRGALPVCLALSVTACLAQQADVLKLENDLTETRAQIRSELRSLREENLPQLHGALETESHRLDRQFNRELDDLARQVIERVDQLKQHNAALDSRLTALDASLRQALDQRDKTVGDQFADFRNSLVQFKAALEQVDAQLEEDRNRAANADQVMQRVLAEQQHDLQALREKLDADTQALRAYSNTNAQKTIEAVNAVLHTNERALNDRLDVQDARVSEIGARLDGELTALRHAGVQYGDNLTDTVRTLAQLREALDSVAGTLGERSDRHTAQLERLEQAQTAQASKTQAIAAHLDAATVSLQSLRQELQAKVARVKQVAASVEQLRDAIQSMQAGLNSRGR